ncbi:MAG: DoxX family protein [Sphingobacteriaceae bacterium]|nr:DoxX family protein [Sphingobacteriaceae bacterium]
MKKFLASKLFRLIWSAGLSLLFYFICPECFSKTTLAFILGILLVLVNLAEFIGKFVWLTHITRFLVGALFIFSGFIKANDPLGFSYKLKEYFEVFQGDTGWAFFEGFAHIALPLAIIVCASEIILGVMLLLGMRVKLTLWLLFAQIAFFTFLTFYSACYNKVTHCGCFGDFLVLKPWESFWKDIALMIMITLLFAGEKNISVLFRPLTTSTAFLAGLIFSIAFPVYAYRNLPPLDFRAYAPGMSIKENMKTPPTYQAPVIETGFIYENLKTGEKKHFNMQNYPWQDTLNWKWFATDNVVVKDAVDPPKITDFTVNDLEGNNVTDIILNDKYHTFWLIMHNLSETEVDESLMAQINDFVKLANQDEIKVIAFTSSDVKLIEEFKSKNKATYDFYIVDGIVLKTMVRANPGLMLVKDGTVIQNWHHNNFPVYGEVKATLMK